MICESDNDTTMLVFLFNRALMGLKKPYGVSVNSQLYADFVNSDPFFVDYVMRSNYDKWHENLKLPVKRRAINE